MPLPLKAVTQLVKRSKPRNGIIKSCISCSKEFYVQKHRISKNPKYCSCECYWVNKHDATWNKGTKGLIKPNKTSFKAKGHLFKGTQTEYKTLHRTIGKLYGKPDECEKCHREGLSGKMIHWANVSGEYKMDRSDWLRLCAKCHFRFDYKVRFDFEYESNIL